MSKNDYGWTDTLLKRESVRWIPRAKFVGELIAQHYPGSSVLDVGCGNMILEKFLPEDCQYLPCDLVRRDERTQVVDLNDAFPNVKGATLITLLGVLEYVHDLNLLFDNLKNAQLPVIMSYHVNNQNKSTIPRGMENYYTKEQLDDLISGHDFHIQTSHLITPHIHQVVFIIKPNK